MNGLFKEKMSCFEMSSDKLATCCRLCLSANGKLHHLFHSSETEFLAVPLSMKVTLCTAIAISQYDLLPQKICQNCLSRVNDWYTFRKKCKKVDSLLKEKVSLQFDESNTKKKVEENEVPDNENMISKDINKSKSENTISTSSREVESTDFKNISYFCEKGPSVLHSKKKFKCDQCPDSFYFFRDLKFHKSLIHNCEKSEKAEEVINNELDIKLEGINVRTRYEMKCCNKLFFSKLKFRKHYNEKHPGEKPFMCETCGKKDFISEETLKRHKILHSGKFRCEICSKTFTCNAILILHKRDKHEDDKPFVCDVCGKRFVTELLMNYHKRFHTGEKKYVCEECGLAVVTSSSLAKHKRIHTKEKPHICHMCGKGFIIKGRLVEHLRVHTGERPYECSICQKGFTMKDKLKRHMLIHSGEKLFSCEYCGNNYSTRYGLSVHLKSHLIKNI